MIPGNGKSSLQTTSTNDLRDGHTSYCSNSFVIQDAPGHYLICSYRCSLQILYFQHLKWKYHQKYDNTRLIQIKNLQNRCVTFGYFVSVCTKLGINLRVNEKHNISSPIKPTTVDYFKVKRITHLVSIVTFKNSGKSVLRKCCTFQIYISTNAIIPGLSVYELLLQFSDDSHHTIKSNILS